jgi:hypothetical protein
MKRSTVSWPLLLSLLWFGLPCLAQPPTPAAALGYVVVYRAASHAFQHPDDVLQCNGVAAAVLSADHQVALALPPGQYVLSLPNAADSVTVAVAPGAVQYVRVDHSFGPGSYSRKLMPQPDAQGAAEAAGLPYIAPGGVRSPLALASPPVLPAP